MAVLYSPLATRLFAYIAKDRLSTDATSDSLNKNIVLNADFYAKDPKILTGNYGFDGYMGVPTLDGTMNATQLQAAAYAGNVAFEWVDPALNPPARALYSAVSQSFFLGLYGVKANYADTIPVVFTHPVLPSSLSPDDFRVILNTGEIVTPISASFIPNQEYNERQTVVLSGYWGNRIPPGSDGSIYPTQLTIVPSDTPLQYITDSGFVSAVGSTVESKNPYVPGNGPKIVGAKLDYYSNLGEGSPLWLPASAANSGFDLYGSEAQYRLRVYTSAGFSPDGITAINPNEFNKFFQLQAADDRGQTLLITQSGVTYQIGSYGSLKVLGLADTGLKQASYNPAYVQDFDNQYDIILSGDVLAISHLTAIRMPSSGAYSPVYNPGGPGNNVAAGPNINWTVPSSDQTFFISNDLAGASYVSYVEIDGPVMKNMSGKYPVGTYVGVAITDTLTGSKVSEYIDPNGKHFYTSIPVESTFGVLNQNGVSIGLVGTSSSVSLDA